MANGLSGFPQVGGNVVGNYRKVSASRVDGRLSVAISHGESFRINHIEVTDGIERGLVKDGRMQGETSGRADGLGSNRIRQENAVHQVELLLLCRTLLTKENMEGSFTLRTVWKAGNGGVGREQVLDDCALSLEVDGQVERVLVQLTADGHGTSDRFGVRLENFVHLVDRNFRQTANAVQDVSLYSISVRGIVVDLGGSSVRDGFWARLPAARILFLLLLLLLRSCGVVRDRIDRAEGLIVGSSLLLVRTIAVLLGSSEAPERFIGQLVTTTLFVLFHEFTV